MKTTTFILKLTVVFLLFTAFKCDDDTDSFTCEDRISQLSEMKATIRNLADASVCNENFICRSIAFGSKPCGGPWGYLVYSTSIDTLKLAELVKKHNQLETRINQECNRISDCAFVSPPQRLECEDNKCIAIY